MTTKLIKKHPVTGSGMGTSVQITSVTYGTPDTGRKAYLQAGLHANEAPGYMVMHHLMNLLDQADREGAVTGEIVLIPAANPVGLDQWNHERIEGRFDTACGINFNRSHPDLVQAVAEKITDRLTQDGQKNKELIREAIVAAVEELSPCDRSEHLKKKLLTLSCDADIVLDLHCDSEAVLHVYTGTPLWPDTATLSARLGARVTLLTEESGGEPYDEACSKIWWKLQEMFPEFPISPACLAATVELRGESDVSHDLARNDAQNLFDFLQERGFIGGNPPEAPPLLQDATPLCGVEHVKAPVPGVIIFHKKTGETVEPGDLIAEVFDPTQTEENRRVTLVHCRYAGILFTLISDRMARQGRILAKIAGYEAIDGKGEKLLTQ